MLSTALKDTAKDTAKDPESLKSAGDTTTTDKDPARMKPLSIVDPSDDDKAEVPAWRAHLGKLFAPLRRAYDRMSLGQKVIIGVLIGIPCSLGVAIVVKGIYDYVECGGHSTQGRRLMKSSDPNPCKDSKYKYAETDCLAIHGSGKGQWTCDFTNWATSNDKKEKNTAVFNTFTWEYRAITSWDMQLPADKTIEESSKYWRDKNQCDGVFRFWQAGGEDDCTVFIKAPANWITAPDLDQQGAYESCGRYGPLCSNGDVSDLFVWKTVDKKIVDLSLGDEHPDFSYILGRFSDLSKWYAKSLAAKVGSSYLDPTEEELEVVNVFEQQLRNEGALIPHPNVMISLLRDKKGNADRAAMAYIKAYKEANSFKFGAQHFDKGFLAKKEAVNIFETALQTNDIRIPDREVSLHYVDSCGGNGDDAAKAYMQAVTDFEAKLEGKDVRIPARYVTVSLVNLKNPGNAMTPEQAYIEVNGPGMDLWWEKTFTDEVERVMWYMVTSGNSAIAKKAKEVLDTVPTAEKSDSVMDDINLAVTVWTKLKPDVKYGPTPIDEAVKEFEKMVREVKAKKKDPIGRVGSQDSKGSTSAGTPEPQDSSKDFGNNSGDNQ